MSDSSDQNLMRVIHYPPLSQNINYNSVRAAAHTDINLITVGRFDRMNLLASS